MVLFDKFVIMCSGIIAVTVTRQQPLHTERTHMFRYSDTSGYEKKGIQGNKSLKQHLMSS